MKNIVLTGLSGSGKSTLAAGMAKCLGMKMIDTDQAIRELTGMTVQEIFERYGEAHFRDLETNVAHIASHMEGTVVSTGGGMVLREENMAALRRAGIVIFLDRPIEHILSDIDWEGRPLLRDGAENLRGMERERRHIYEGTCDAVFGNYGDVADALPSLVALARAELLKAQGGGGYAVIGDPIGHTLSPRIHGVVFRRVGVREPYEAMHVGRGRLAAFVEGVRGAELKGFNVTSPHKSEIIPLLDNVEESALRCGSVNTVVKRNGKLYGYNTDMEGLTLAIQDIGYSYKNSKVMLLGTGGAAGSVAFKASLEGAREISVHGRRPEAVQSVCDIARNAGIGKVSARDLGESSLRAGADSCDILLNCIPLGMTGVGGALPSFDFLQALPARALVVDLIYSPPRTALLLEAERLGRKVLGGLPMLIYQAILADEHYLGKKLDCRAMYQIVADALAAEKKEKTAV